MHDEVLRLGTEVLDSIPEGLAVRDNIFSAMESAQRSLEASLQS